jgi:hypothetical protein
VLLLDRLTVSSELAEAACVTKLLGFGQISFTSPDFLRDFTFRDIHYGADNFFVSRLVPQAVQKIVNMLYRAIRNQQTVRKAKVTSTLRLRF